MKSLLTLWLPSLVLFLSACSGVFLEKKPSEPPPPPRTAEAQALRINLALFRHRAERFRREALYMQLQQEGRLLLTASAQE